MASVMRVVVMKARVAAVKPTMAASRATRVQYALAGELRELVELQSANAAPDSGEKARMVNAMKRPGTIHPIKNSAYDGTVSW
jgi:hypothetical protein